MPKTTRTRTGRRLLVGAVAVSLAAFMTGPSLLEGLARREAGGPAALLLVVASLLVSWPVWGSPSSDSGSCSTKPQSACSGLTPASWTSASRSCATAPTAAPTGSSRSSWPPSWSQPGPGPSR